MKVEKYEDNIINKIDNQEIKLSYKDLKPKIEITPKEKTSFFKRFKFNFASLTVCLLILALIISGIIVGTSSTNKNNNSSDNTSEKKDDENPNSKDRDDDSKGEEPSHPVEVIINPSIFISTDVETIIIDIEKPSINPGVTSKDTLDSKAYYILSLTIEKDNLVLKIINNNDDNVAKQVNVDKTKLPDLDYSDESIRYYISYDKNDNLCVLSITENDVATFTPIK